MGEGVGWILVRDCHLNVCACARAGGRQSVGGGRVYRIDIAQFQSGEDDGVEAHHIWVGDFCLEQAQRRAAGFVLAGPEMAQDEKWRPPRKID